MMMLSCDHCGCEGASRKVVTITDTKGYKAYNEAHDLCRACLLVLLECLWSLDGKGKNDRDAKEAVPERTGDGPDPV